MRKSRTEYFLFYPTSNRFWVRLEPNLLSMVISNMLALKYLSKSFKKAMLANISFAILRQSYKDNSL
jgi:hypothetical protein